MYIYCASCRDYAIKYNLFMTLPEHLNSPPGFCRVRVALSFVLCVIFCRSLFVLFLLFFAIVLSVLQFTVSDYLFSIFNMFLLFHFSVPCLSCNMFVFFTLENISLLSNHLTLSVHSEG
jgi:hypothetical protein